MASRNKGKPELLPRRRYSGPNLCVFKIICEFCLLWALFVLFALFAVNMQAAQAQPAIKPQTISQVSPVYAPPTSTGALTPLHGVNGASAPALTLNRPISTAAVQRLKIENGKIWRIPTDLLFVGDQPALSSSGEGILSSLLRELESEDGETTVACFSDAMGFENFDLKLSQKRADIVRDWLVSKLIAGDEIKSIGFGRKHPLVRETGAEGRDNPEARRKNRRLEIRIVSRLHDVADSHGLIESSVPPVADSSAASGGKPGLPVLDDPDTHWESAIDGEGTLKNDKEEPKVLTEAEKAAQARAELFKNLPPTPEKQRSSDGSFGSGGSASVQDESITSVSGARVHAPTAEEKQEHEWAIHSFGTWRD